MPQEIVSVDGSRVVARLSFEGIAKYSAYLYEPAPNNKWKLVRILVEDASSIDARPDVLLFDAPGTGKQLLFFLNAQVTTAVVPADVGATAEFEQDDAKKGEAAEAGHIDAGYATVVVRALLVRA